MTLPYKSVGWKTAPISCTCEHLDGSGLKDMRYCGKPTEYAYPAHGEGWMALCGDHGKHHLPNIFPIEEVIQSGEKFEGAPCHEFEALLSCECGMILTEEEACAGYTVNGKPACERCWQEACDEQ